MVPALLYILFTKLRSLNWGIVKRKLLSRLLIRSNQIIPILVILLLLVSFVLAAQKQARYYKVMRNGSEIGWVNLERRTDSNATTLSMESEVNVSFILTFSSSAKEISQFRDGKLYHSYLYRKMNGNVKADRNTHLVGNGYEVEDKSKKTKLNLSPVTYNTLCMYFQEPIGRTKVYSDNHQCFIDIEKKPDGAYRISTPDGASSSFYYTSGVCYKVKITKSFYSAALMLK
jgi:hypothetical protein